MKVQGMESIVVEGDSFQIVQMAGKKRQCNTEVEVITEDIWREVEKFRVCEFFVFAGRPIAHTLAASGLRGDALNALKNNLVDPNNVLQSWDPTTGSPCSWYHVTCNSRNSVTRVCATNSVMTNLLSIFVSLSDLQNVNLTGQLVPQLADLRSLEYLELYANNLSGQVPNELGNLTDLVSLDLYLNNLSGPIPKSLGNLQKLRFLDLSNNRLTGVIPVNGSFSLFNNGSFANNDLVFPPAAPQSTARVGNTAIAGVAAGAAILFAALVIALGYWRQRKLPDRFCDVPERPESQAPLDWPTRKHIALGAARGLAYLHNHCDPKIIHRDVKVANIFLDEEFEAVVGDFGLAKLMDYKDTHVTTIVCGTIGHIAPEYLSTGKSSEKTDVFGYGVMLLELITGQRASDLARLGNDHDVMLLDRGSQMLSEEVQGLDKSILVHKSTPFSNPDRIEKPTIVGSPASRQSSSPVTDCRLVKGLLNEKKLEMLVDTDMQGNYVHEEVEELIQMVLLCTQETPNERPKMSEVVRMIEGDGLAERWEAWQKEEVFRLEFSNSQHAIADWIVADSTSNLCPVELSGPR
ncbi:hypothetical protein RHSIM_Rhsim05G0110100 [Rhododendron simsii]|uniref:Protein kinase domain-containing protein n=1 Tax=Rhododendron simsii TaxID=118357 RepID=A0A834LNU2_RHOSS|nr:hypothetical protein RHSIM_Rhsim05G0110100 [Rhododendron simsii]